MDTTERKMTAELEKAIQEIERLRQENAELRNRLGLKVSEPESDYTQTGPASADSNNKTVRIQEALSTEQRTLAISAEKPAIDFNSSTREKIKLFRSLFRGREDVYALFWLNERTGKKGYSPACEDPWSSRNEKPKKYFALTDEAIISHLSGERTIGVYPLLKDDTCWFLACDFDKQGWALDASAYLNTCKNYTVPAYLERSRSGNGGHVWTFFSAPVSATSARQLGIRLLKETMVVRAEMESFFSKYGFIIVDECHHLPAFTFETCIKKAPVRYILGLTATPYRRDGLQEIITLQCGPIRHTMAQVENSFSRTLIVRETPFTYSEDGDFSIQEIFRALVRDEARNELIRTDVSNALAEGRRCLILSHWKEHCELLAQGLRESGKTPLVLSGTLSKKARSAMLSSLQETPSDKELLIIATGQYLGEGFDCPQVDTLFLAFPLSFKGKLIQYVGRALRSHQDKSSVRVYDYVDRRVPILRKMYAKRETTYRSLKFASENNQRRDPPAAALDNPGIFTTLVLAE
jgi:hypothetical protein